MELLSVYLSAIDDAHFKVIVRSDFGQAEADSQLPFFETKDRWRTTLIKALEVNEFRTSAFPQEEEQAWMAQQGWLSGDRQSFHPSMLVRIGQAIYDSLFPVGEVRDVLQQAISHAEGNETQLQIRLEFNAKVTQHSRLPDYPWELAHDGQRFLAHHQVCFSRYITSLANVPKPSAVENLKVLLVSSKASDQENGFPPLSNKEQQAILQGLEKAEAEGQIQVEVLKPATLNQLRVYLTEQQPQVFHFDGHGVFGKRCNKEDCRTIHKDLNAKTCNRCGTDLPKEPQGYLLFETEEDETDYVSARELGELLQKTRFRDQPTPGGGVAVAVLSACKSGMALGGESVFNGLAQQLISHRLPAVVAMQYTVRVDAATQFAAQFYRSLGCKNSLATAISQGQEAMGAEGNQWYRPMLYLRWRDDEGGQLFATPEIAPVIPTAPNQRQDPGVTDQAATTVPSREPGSSLPQSSIQQEVTGNGNQIIGQAMNSTIISVTDGGQVILPPSTSAGSGPAPSGTSGLKSPKDLKREALKREYALKSEIYQRVSREAELNLNPASQVMLQRQADELYEELIAIDAKLKALNSQRE